MKSLLPVLALAVTWAAYPGPLLAQKQDAKGAAAASVPAASASGAPAPAAPPASAGSGVPTTPEAWLAAYPAPAGTIPWQLLMQAKTVQKPDKKFGPVFTREIRELDRQSVKLYGFMMPLDQSQKQRRFLLSPFPPHCAFCLPAGPESLVEVVADKPFDFTYEPIVVSGRLAVLDDELLYYRVTKAVPGKP